MRYFAIAAAAQRLRLIHTKRLRYGDHSVIGWCEQTFTVATPCERTLGLSSVVSFWSNLIKWFGHQWLALYTMFLFLSVITRMHSSRMRTGRTLTVFRKLENPPSRKFGGPLPQKFGGTPPPPLKIWRNPHPGTRHPPSPCEQNNRQV